MSSEEDNVSTLLSRSKMKLDGFLLGRPRAIYLDRSLLVCLLLAGMEHLPEDL